MSCGIKASSPSSPAPPCPPFIGPRDLLNPGTRPGNEGDTDAKASVSPSLPGRIPGLSRSRGPMKGGHGGAGEDGDEAIMPQDTDQPPSTHQAASDAFTRRQWVKHCQKTKKARMKSPLTAIHVCMQRPATLQADKPNKNTHTYTSNEAAQQHTAHQRKNITS